MKRLFICLLVLFPGSLLLADTLSIGNSLINNYNYVSRGATGTAMQTDIDLGNPAPAAGEITSVQFRWTAECANGVKVKFFRRVGDTLTVIAERGPFNTTSGDNSVALTPSVPVLAGDLIGLTRLTSCGAAQALQAPVELVPYVVYPVDVTGPVTLSSGQRLPGFLLTLHGDGTTTAAGETRRAIIPVVGSAAGLNNSHFKTELQVKALAGRAFSGRLIFHPAGAAASASDPSMALSVDQGKTVDFPDIVAAMGQTGLGSIDIMTDANALLPTFVVRVFNDAGAAGTSGFMEDVLPIGGTRRVLSPAAASFIVGPADVARARLNIGVRTLDAGAQILAWVYDKDGHFIRSVTKTYAPNFFEQTDAATFTGGAFGSGQTIEILVQSGSLVVYGASTDNVTNDPAVQIAEPII